MGIFEKITGTFCKPAGTQKKHPQHIEPQRAKPKGKTDGKHDSGVQSKPICLGMDAGKEHEDDQAPPVMPRRVEPIGDGNTMHSNEDGSYLVVDAQGTIIRTCDVLGTKREFARDKYSKQLMIKRFGAWTKPQDACLEEDGTLSYSADGVDIVERLNGVHMHRHQDTDITIITDHVHKTEVVKNPDGEITKRQTTKDGETFGIWRNLQLEFFSETFYQPRRYEALTPNGDQPLVYVSRAERRILEPNVMQEKFFFRNPLKNERQVTLSLRFGTGLLMLKSVVSVSSTINIDVASETVFELKQALTIRADLPGYRGPVPDVISVRIFDAGDSIGVGFKNTSGTERIMLVAKPMAEVVPPPMVPTVAGV